MLIFSFLDELCLPNLVVLFRVTIFDELTRLEEDGFVYTNQPQWIIFHLLLFHPVKRRCGGFLLDFRGIGQFLFTAMHQKSFHHSMKYGALALNIHIHARTLKLLNGLTTTDVKVDDASEFFPFIIFVVEFGGVLLYS